MINPEGKLTIITDYGAGKSKVVDGVSMETARGLERCLHDRDAELLTTREINNQQMDIIDGLQKENKQLRELLNDQSREGEE